MVRYVRSGMGRRWLALWYLLTLTVAALLVLVIAQAVDGPSATGVAGVALVLMLLVAVGLTYALAALAAAVTNRRMIAYRRRDGVTVESNDPPVHPIRPRAPGIA